MKSKTVYFVSNSSNKRIVSILQKFEKFSCVHFVPLEERKAATLVTKIEQERREPAVLIWSSGYYHYLSYFFDYKSGKVIKRNIDAHSDWIPREVDPFSYALRRKYQIVNFANHMAQSEFQHGVKPQFSIPKYNLWCAKNELLDYLSRAYSKNVISLEKKDELFDYFLSNVVKLTDPFPKNFRIHISIDLDSVPFFPSALSQWICPGGFKIEKIREAILLAKHDGNLVRLDFGGCMNRLPKFNYCDIENLNAPGFGISYALAFKDKHGIYLGDGKRRAVPQKIIDRIGSYIVACYRAILEAVLFD